MAVSENDTSQYAADLLTSSCTSCLSLSSIDRYTATLRLRVMDLYLADQTFIYNVSVYLKKYHDSATVGEPVLNFPINITIANTTTCMN